MIFTCCHLQYGWVGLLYVFFLGVVLGLLRWKTGSLYPCIVLFMLNNLAHWLDAALRSGS